MNQKIDLDKSQYATLETIFEVTLLSGIEKKLERTQAHEIRQQ